MHLPVIHLDIGMHTCRFGIDWIACKFPLSDLDFNSLGWYRHDDHVVRFGSEHSIEGGSERIATVSLHRQWNLVVKAIRQYGRTELEFKWSPGAIRDESRERFHAAIGQFVSGGYEELLSDGWVSYIEAACDIFHARTAQLLIYRPRHAYSRAKHNVVDGSTTLYIGRGTERNRYTAYDKAEQMRRRYGYVLRPSRCRIENRRKLHMLFADLANCSNWFSGLLVANRACARSCDDSPEWHFFLDRCVRLGVQRAISSCSDNVRRRYIRFLERAREEWWQSDFIWEHWPIECAAFDAHMRGAAELPEAVFLN